MSAWEGRRAVCVCVCVCACVCYAKGIWMCVHKRRSSIYYDLTCMSSQSIRVITVPILVGSTHASDPYEEHEGHHSILVGPKWCLLMVTVVVERNVYV